MLYVGFFSFAVCVVVQLSDRSICCSFAIVCAIFSACALVILSGCASVGAWFQFNRVTPAASMAMIAALRVLDVDNCVDICVFSVTCIGVGALFFCQFLFKYFSGTGKPISDLVAIFARITMSIGTNKQRILQTFCTHIIGVSMLKIMRLIW